MAARKAAAKKTTKKKRRLGMGLSGMIGVPVEVSPPEEPKSEGQSGGRSADTKSHKPSRQAAASVASPTPSQTAGAADGLVVVPIAEIRPNAHQPRHAIEPASLEPLAASIRTAGIMQPIVVRPRGADGMHELVAGERRWRAATIAGLTGVPAVVRQIDDQTAAEWAIIENVQREDLDAIERGDAFRQLQEGFGLTHAEIAEQVGLTRAGVTNQIRLCELDDGIRTLIRRGALSGGHGRSLLGIASIDQRLEIAKQAIEGEWSVRELERRVRQLGVVPGSGTGSKPPVQNSRAHLDDLERQLGEHLGTRVRIQTGRKRDRGRLSMEFYDLEQFDGLLTRLGFKSS
ncbi:MAG: ParB/RepB/Spo0J family partition protein [Phycisphaerales bacterium]|nr:ParB/RepB/Spo0J family partition protein [Phycisphaerales bacterium]